MPTPRELIARRTVPIGVVTPSGNDVVERVTLAIGASVPRASFHFSRTPVSGSSDPFPDSYDPGMLQAATLLSHVDPAVIVWNGSKAASIDFAIDRVLVADIERATGRPATTSILALDEVLLADGIERIAIVSPYSESYGAKLERTFAQAGYRCVASAHAGLADNLSFSRIPLDDIVAMGERVAAAKPEAIVTVCTNFPAAAVVCEIEARTGIPVYDTVALGVWAALRMADVDPRPAAEWGRLFGRAA